MIEPHFPNDPAQRAPRAADVERLTYRGLELDDFQAQAIRALDLGHSVLVGAPTGAGKTLIAEYALDRCMREGRRIVYTAPVKALSNQKFRDFSATYGDRIGVLTGDVSIHPEAQALIMTTEILRNTIFENPRRLADVDYVVFDEVHYIDDEERGTVWEESIIFAPEHIRFVCLSATVPNLRQFAAWIRHVRKSPIDVIEELRRPVPLAHHLYVQGFGIGSLADLKRMDERLRRSRGEWEDWRRITGGSDKDLLGRDGQRLWRKKLLDHIQANRQFPVLHFLFSRRECEERAEENVFRSLLTQEERERADRLLADLGDRYGLVGDPAFEKLHRLLLRGIGYHHAGLLPTVKEVVERMFTANLVKLVFATETFALGINMPARTVVFDTLHKFDGVRRTYLKTREYQQMAGRAGRRGMDEFGHVYASVEWPFVHYDQVERILTGPVEEVDSQFNLSYSTLLSLFVRLGKDLFEACEKSFANFRSEHRRGGRHRFQPGGSFKGIVDQVRRRLALLRHLGYIEGDRLTEKGEFARRINGYEVQVTEFLFEGLLDQLSAEQMNVLFNAIVFESKKKVWYEKIDKRRFGAIRDRAVRVVHGVRFQEKTHGISDATKELEFLLAATVDVWSRGCEWADLESWTSASDGDLVRTFRLTHQLERQVYHALDQGHPIRERLRRGMLALNRDVVDAERQLRLG